jgi:hypothetical protein
MTTKHWYKLSRYSTGHSSFPINVAEIEKKAGCIKKHENYQQIALTMSQPMEAGGLGVSWGLSLTVLILY